MLTDCRSHSPDVAGAYDPQDSLDAYNGKRSGTQHPAVCEEVEGVRDVLQINLETKKWVCKSFQECLSRVSVWFVLSLFGLCQGSIWKHVKRYPVSRGIPRVSFSPCVSRLAKGWETAPKDGRAAACRQPWSWLSCAPWSWAETDVGAVFFREVDDHLRHLFLCFLHTHIYTYVCMYCNVM